MAVEEFSKTKIDFGIDSPLNQLEMAKYSDVSTSTIRKREKERLPHGSLRVQTKYYDKLECKK